MSFLWGSSKWDPRAKHCYIPGGSSGLGLALAQELTRRGAHVSIVARNRTKLAEALKTLEAARSNAEQRLSMHSHSLASGAGAKAALAEACAAHGGAAPDAVFLCAGASHPGFFVEMNEEDLKKGMDDGYWVQAWTAWATSQMMARQKRKGKIVFVSSTLGYMSFLGYSSYSPAKHALRGLADTLHSELMLYDINVHIFFPPTMYTPGYEEENNTKPKLTLQIEEDDKGLTAEAAATGLLRGIENGQTHITADMMTDLFRASTRGSSPGHNYLFDGILDTIARIGVPIWRHSVDSKVRGHREEHQGYLDQRGFFAKSD